MGQQVKCNECDHVFESQGGGGDSACPACGSNNIVFQKASFFQEKKKLLMIIGGVIALILLIILLGGREKCDPETLVIKNVIVDADPNCPQTRLASIKVIAEKGSDCPPLRYTIDHGKTTKQKNNKFYKLENGRYDVYVAFDNEKGGEYEWIPWKDNPIIIRDTCPEPPKCDYTEVLRCDTVSPSCTSMGKIIVHAASNCPPLTYILNDSLSQDDSIFIDVPGGAYIVTVIDSSGLNISTFQDTVFMDPKPTEEECEENEPEKCLNPPSKSALEAEINSLFNTDRGDQDLQTRILNKFSSQAVPVKGTIVETSQSYTIYQYLFRQNIGLPGTLKVEVKQIKHNTDCKITSIEIKETKKQ